MYRVSSLVNLKIHSGISPLKLFSLILLNKFLYKRNLIFNIIFFFNLIFIYIIYLNKIIIIVTDI